MSNWKECKLGDVMDLFQGLAINSKTKYLLVEKSDLPLLRIKDLQENTAEFFVNESEVPEKCIANENDLIFTRTGIVGLVFMGKKGVVHNNCFRIVPKIDDIFLKFYYYYFNREDMRDYLTGISAGSVQPDMNHSIFKNEIIPVPPLEEQKAIAEVLSSLDDKIDLLHRQNQTLESLAQTLFRQWFIEEAKEEWEEKPLSYFGDIICGKTPSKSNLKYFDGNVPFIKIPDMHGNTFIFKTTDTLSELGKESQKNKTLPPKSICVSCIATVGLVSMNIIESQTNQQINSIIPNKDIYRYFLYLFMQSSYDLLHAMASGGTATLNLNTGDFSKMEILKPDDETLKNFHEIIEPKFDKIFINSKQIQILENLRDTLLPKLLSGEVKVK
ncbi:restriction endonuclease subunit S [Aliarcobacter butzleri]|uniref:restriction endonuclease subunit S n=1 Tax=Aliarcobacter butzleri TaxID=28197 RepID=UPI002B24244A|nr:restriction endonuclease subunit S [Aliarcobacter butzleri]